MSARFIGRMSILIGAIGLTILLGNCGLAVLANVSAAVLIIPSIFVALHAAATEP